MTTRFADDDVRSDRSLVPRAADAEEHARAGLAAIPGPFLAFDRHAERRFVLERSALPRGHVR